MNFTGVLGRINNEITVSRLPVGRAKGRKKKQKNVSIVRQAVEKEKK